MSAFHSQIKSFSFAIGGIKTAFKEEPNFKIHTVLTLVALGLAFFLGFSKIEWLILLFTITFVLVLELINTAIEEIVNLVSPEVSEGAKAAKDVSAGAVLIVSISAVIVGIILFLPKLLAMFF